MAPSRRSHAGAGRVSQGIGAAGIGNSAVVERQRAMAGSVSPSCGIGLSHSGDALVCALHISKRRSLFGTFLSCSIRLAGL